MWLIRHIWIIWSSSYPIYVSEIIFSNHAFTTTHQKTLWRKPMYPTFLPRFSRRNQLLMLTTFSPLCACLSFWFLTPLAFMIWHTCTTYINKNNEVISTYHKYNVCSPHPLYHSVPCFPSLFAHLNLGHESLRMVCCIMIVLLH